MYVCIEQKEKKFPQIRFVYLCRMRVRFEDMSSIPTAATTSQYNPGRAITSSWASLKVVRAQTLKPVCLGKILLAKMPTDMRKDEHSPRLESVQQEK